MDDEGEPASQPASSDWNELTDYQSLSWVVKVEGG